MPAPSSSTRRVLIVEDDREMVTVLERSARRRCRDLDVDWAVDVRSAQERLREGRYDAVIADYALGEHERGTALHDPCRRHQAGAAFAIMSAVPLADLMNLVRDPSLRLLPKPFTTQEFASFVESLLESRPDGAVACDAAAEPEAGGA